jgi:hypothetical protein
MGRRSPGSRIDRNHALAERKLDSAVHPERLGSEEQILHAPFAREELLRERRAFVGRKRLLADENELALESLGTQCLGTTGTGEPRAHDEDAAGRH